MLMFIQENKAIKGSSILTVNLTDEAYYREDLTYCCNWTGVNFGYWRRHQHNVK